uniref:Uncharacterized protein n=1 Tax=Romanomermis culicivorax TaxID=13658 RepID=A0A915IEP1_ROMCU
MIIIQERNLNNSESTQLFEMLRSRRRVTDIWIVRIIGILPALDNDRSSCWLNDTSCILYMLQPMHRPSADGKFLAIGPSLMTDPRSVHNALYTKHTQH